MTSIREDLSSIYILGYRSQWPPSVWGFIIYLHPWLQITMTTIHVRIYHLFTSLVTDHHDHHPCEDLSSIYILSYRSPWPTSVWGFIIYLHPWLSVSVLQITMTTIRVKIYHLFTSLVVCVCITDRHDHNPCEYLSSIYILGCLLAFHLSVFFLNRLEPIMAEMLLGLASTYYDFNYIQ